MDKLNIAPSDIKYLIGKGGIILKEKILPKGIKYNEGEKPKINFKVVDQEVFVEITTNSDKIKDIIIKNINKIISNIDKSVYYFKVPLEPHKKGLLIGSGGIYINKIIKSIDELSSGKVKIDIEDYRYIKKGKHYFGTIYIDGIEHGEVCIVKVTTSTKDREGVKLKIREELEGNLKRIYDLE